MACINITFKIIIKNIINVKYTATAISHKYTKSYKLFRRNKNIQLIFEKKNNYQLLIIILYLFKST